MACRSCSRAKRIAAGQTAARTQKEVPAHVAKEVSRWKKGGKAIGIIRPASPVYGKKNE